MNSKKPVKIPQKLNNDNIGTSVNNSNNNNNNTINNNNKSKSYEEIFNEYVRNIILKNEYVDSKTIMKVLQSKIPGLRYLRQFQLIQNLNRDIDMYIDAYKYSHTIKIYNELVNYIIEMFNSKMHDNEEAFIENIFSIGIGNIKKHEKIQEIFGELPDDDDRSKTLTPELVYDVVYKYLDETISNSNHSYFSIDKLNLKIRNLLGFNSRRELTVGVSIDPQGLKRLFHTYRNSFMKCRLKLNEKFFEDNFNRKLFKSLDDFSLISKKSSELLLQSKRLVANRNIDIDYLYAHLQENIIDINDKSYDSYMEYFVNRYLIFSNKSEVDLKSQHMSPDVKLRFDQNPKSIIEKLTQMITALSVFFSIFKTDINEITYKNNSTANVTHINPYNEAIANDNSILINATSIISEIENTEIDKNQNATSEKLHSKLDWILHDIPSYDVNILVDTIRKLKFDCDLSFSSDGITILSATIDDSKIYNYFSAKKNHNKWNIEIENYKCLAIGSLLFYRFIQSETYCNLSSISINTSVVDLVFNSMELDSSSESIRSNEGRLFSFLGKFEKSVAKRLNVPYFQFVYGYTFADYLVNYHSDIVDKIFKAFSFPSTEPDNHEKLEMNNDNRPDKEFLCELMIECMEELSNHSINNSVEYCYELENRILRNHDINNFNQISNKSFLHFLNEIITYHAETESEKCLQQLIMKVIVHQNIQTVGVDFENIQDLNHDVDSNNNVIYNSSNVSQALFEYLLSYNRENSQSEEEIIEWIECTVGKFNPKFLTNLSAPVIKQDKSSQIIAISKLNSCHFTYPENIREIAISTLAVAPIGQLCKKSCHWPYFYDSLQCSIVDFVISEQDNEYLRNKKFLLVGNDDLVALPIDDINLNIFFTMISKSEYLNIASYCLSAVNKLIDVIKFSSLILGYFNQIETSISNQSIAEVILNLSLNIACSLYLPVHKALVLEYCLETAMSQYEISFESFEKELFKQIINKPNSNLFTNDIIEIALQTNQFIKLRQLILAHGIEKFACNNLAESPDIVVENDHLNGYHTTVDKSTFNINDLSNTKSDVLYANIKKVDENDNSKKFIENLLINQFGYNEKGEKPSSETPSQINLKHAMTHLAGGLYSSDIHFILELIQNADDNSYNIEDVPTLKVKLYEKELIFFNNEMGFSDDNIRSVCQIGQSTKSNRSGYIGQKGIGYKFSYFPLYDLILFEFRFKSVFSVANIAEIHSNGFHIRFDKRQSMIEPIWIDETDSSKYPLMIENNSFYNTILKLYLDERSIKNFTTISQDIDETFDDKLIIFLNKLCRLILEDRNQNLIIENTKVVLSPNWLKLIKYKSFTVINLNETVETFWLIKKLNVIPQIKRTPDSEFVPESTQISLGFKFINSETMSTITLDSNGEYLPVYSYLPTKTTVFKFLVQADFVLESSRERIREESEWNRFLLSFVPQMYCDVILELSNWIINEPNRNQLCPMLNQMTVLGYKIDINIKVILTLLPRSNQVSSDKTFKTITDQIYVKLIESKFLPSERGTLACSKNLIYTSNYSTFRSLIPNDLLYQSTGKEYYDQSIIFEDEIIKLLNIQIVDIDLIIKCLEYLSKTLVSNKLNLIVGCLLALEFVINSSNSSSLPFRPIPLFKPVSVKKVLAKSNNSINTKFKLPIPIIQKLKSLNIWLTTNNQYTTLELSSTHLIIENESNEIKSLKPSYSIFKSSLACLHSDFVLHSDEIIQNGGQIISKFLIKNFSLESGSSESQGGSIEYNSSETIIKYYILPEYEKGENSLISIEIAAAFLSYIYLSEILLKNLEIKNRIIKSGILIPVATMKTDHVLFAKNILISTNLSNIPLYEVHLGVEFADSATDLLHKEISTALQQFDWIVMDPLVALLILGKSDEVIKVVIDNITMNLKDIKSYFSDTDRSILSSHKLKLMELGLVDLFGIYNTSKDDELDFQCPHLFKFISYLLKNGKFVPNKDTIFCLPKWMEESFRNLGVNIKYFESIPLFLPYPEDCCISVSKSIYHTMMIIAKLICKFVVNIQNKLVLRYSFIMLLRCCCWYPAYVHDSLSNHFGLHLSDNNYILTSPRNLHMEVSNGLHVNSIEYSRSCHHLHVPVKSYYNDNINLQLQIFNFNLIEIHFQNRYDLNNLDIVNQLLIWMSSQIFVYGSVNYFNSLYSNLYNCMSKFPHNLGIMKLVENDLPFLWIPNEKTENASIVIGKLFPLSQIIAEDSTKYFTSHSLPNIRVLMHYYEDPKFVNIFIRKRFCNVCRANEGMFGMNGAAKNKVFGNQKCCCNDESIGMYFPNLPGLIKNSPGLLEMLMLIIYIKNNVGESNFEICKNNVKDKLELISREIWKCFHTRDSLHSYSCKDLRSSIEYFKNTQILPTIDGKFVSLGDVYENNILAVDDKLLYKLFESDITLPMIIDALPTDHIMEYSFFTDVPDELSYDIDILEANHDKFMNAPSNYFDNCVQNIQGIIFFAPKTMKSLMKLLNIPVMSSKIEVLQVNVSKIPVHEYIINILNTLLFTSQYFLYFKYYNYFESLQQLDKLQYLPKLLSLSINFSPIISRSLKFSYHNVDIVREQILPYYFDLDANELYLLMNVNNDTLCEILLNLVISTIKIDLAIITKNQNIDIVNDLEEYLNKLIRTKVFTVLKAIETMKFTFDNFSEEISDSNIWKLSYAFRDEELIVPIELSSETAKLAMVGFENILTKSKVSHEKKVLEKSQVISSNKLQLYQSILNETVNFESATAVQDNYHLSTGDFNHSIPKNISNIRNDENNDVILPLPKDIHLDFNRSDFNYSSNISHDQTFKSQLNYNSTIPEHSKSSNDANDRTSKYLLSPSSTAETIHSNLNNSAFNYNGNDSQDQTFKSHSSTISDYSRNVTLITANNTPPLRKNSNLKRSIIEDLTMTNDEIQSYAKIELDLLNESHISNNSNVITGRIGERLGYEMLLKLFDKDMVTWENYPTEQGHPYDVTIRVDNTTKFCEVKTRSIFLDNQTRINNSQWFISVHELECSKLNTLNYFCIFITLYIKDGNIVNTQKYIVGSEYGLISAIQNEDVKLLLQINIH